MMNDMYINSRPILYVVGEATRYSAAQLLPSSDSETIWEPLHSFWALIYTGLPYRILVDQRRNLGQSQPFISLANRSNFEVEQTGIEAHSILVTDERCLDPLRKTFRKMKRP